MKSVLIVSAIMIMTFAELAQAKPCGLSGSIEERLKDCASEETLHRDYKYISKDEQGHYLLLDTKSNLVWTQYFSVMEQKKYFKNIDLRDVKSVCRRLTPFEIQSNASGWRLPLVDELKSAIKDGNTNRSDYVLTSDYETYSRMQYDGYSYDVEFKNFPVVFSEKTKKTETASSYIDSAQFRCVIERKLLDGESIQPDQNECSITLVNFDPNDLRLAKLTEKQGFNSTDNYARFIIELDKKKSEFGLDAEYRVYERGNPKPIHEKGGFNKKVNQVDYIKSWLPSCSKLNTLSRN